MSFRIGFFDLFSYTLPGVIYFLAGLNIAHALSLWEIPFALSQLSFAHILAVGAFAYMLGLLCDPIARRWYKLFVSKNAIEERIEELQQMHKSRVNLRFDKNDWPIFLAYIKKESMEVADDIEKFNATHIMLRNISFALLLLGMLQLLSLMYPEFVWIHLPAALFFFLFSVIAIRQSIKYESWFISMIFESIVARKTSLADFVAE